MLYEVKSRDFYEILQNILKIYLKVNNLLEFWEY